MCGGMQVRCNILTRTISYYVTRPNVNTCPMLYGDPSHLHLINHGYGKILTYCWLIRVS